MYPPIYPHIPMSCGASGFCNIIAIKTATTKGYIYFNNVIAVKNSYY